jgi:hypothetical protein
MESKDRNNGSTGKNNENKTPLTVDQINSDRITQVLKFAASKPSQLNTFSLGCIKILGTTDMWKPPRFRCQHC